MSKRLASAAIDNVLTSKDLEVNSTLIPTKVELEEAYWKELKPIVEEDESVSHHSEGDEVEHDVEPQNAFHQHSSRESQPPPILNEINIEDLLRMKMEKLERRLQAVISTHLINCTAYVSEYEPKGRLENEAGFDDVTDVPAVERNVDLPKEDLKLEEEVRGKNVGGKELETEPGFDDVRDVPAVKTNVEAREKDPKLEEEVRGKNVEGKDLENEAGSGNDINEQENEKMVKESVGK
ncbi:Hypothetical predicted protein [Olea europaea subsp. europaea]|uniref:Uncharacterized protein n=1 Tax=Olea europaea subsp. europaea TaxID=158383 RepID=A0A8S0VFE7_OLEEU|nr:Hypothetical predicted protein [Olea europaea subsp. europaea]